MSGRLPPAYVHGSFSTPFRAAQHKCSICAPVTHKTEWPIRVNRPTSFIKRKAGATLLHSARTAAALHRPFNTFVTISLWKLGGDGETVSLFIRELIERHFHRWSIYRPRSEAKPRNGPPTYAWVAEAPNGFAHVHWMLHIQSGREVAFAMALQRWVARRTGAKIIPEGVIQMKPVIEAEGLKLYFAKGLDPHLARLWRIRPTDCGSVSGVRARVSRNLGPSEWQPRKQAYLRSQRRAA